MGTFPWQRFSTIIASPRHGSMNGGTAAWSSGCAQAPYLFWPDFCSTSVSIERPWGTTCVTNLYSNVTGPTMRWHWPKAWGCVERRLEAQPAGERVIYSFWGIGPLLLLPISRRGFREREVGGEDVWGTVLSTFMWVISQKKYRRLLQVVFRNLHVMCSQK